MTRLSLGYSAGDEEHDAAVGRDANLSGVHWDGTDHGLGQQGHRDPVGGDGTPGWGVHAQEGSEAQVPL